MLIGSVTNDGALPVLEKLAAFTEGRHRVLLENVANLDTPGYRPKDVGLGQFQAALAEAAQRRSGKGDALQVGEQSGWRWDSDGSLKLQPQEVGPENILFHDGTNASVERQMSELVKNAMTHQVAVELLRRSYGRVLQAIRGHIA
jgi:flagellar basal-body rod protein FlgB